MGSRPIRSTSTACQNPWQPEPELCRSSSWSAESKQQGCRCAAAYWVSISRQEGIYRSNVGRKGRERQSCPPPALTGVDKSPVDYTLAGCSPAGAASASPTGFRMRQSSSAGQSIPGQWQHRRPGQLQQSARSSGSLNRKADLPRNSRRKLSELPEPPALNPLALNSA